MQREGDEIIFNKGEQELFHVPSRVPAATALETADVFRDVAAGLVERASELDDESPLDMNRLPQMLGRATALRTFADCVENNCTYEEIIEHLTRKDTK